MFFCLLACCLTGLAEETTVKIDLTQKGWSQDQSLNNVSISQDGVTVSFAQNDATTNTKYYNGSVRLYKPSSGKTNGGAIKISVTDSDKIISASFTKNQTGTTTQTLTVANDKKSAEYINKSGSTVNAFVITVVVDKTVAIPTSCAAPVFDTEDGSNVYPGQQITATCTTYNSTVYINGVAGENAKTCVYTVPEDAAVGSTITLTAYATVQGADGIIKSDEVTSSYTVVEKPLSITLTQVEFEYTNSSYGADHSYSDSYADYKMRYSWNNSKINWNLGNKNGGANSGLVINCKPGYAISKIEMTNPTAAVNVYSSDTEYEKPGDLSSATALSKTIAANASGVSEYTFDTPVEHAGLRPNGTSSMNFVNIIVYFVKVGEPEPDAVATPGLEFSRSDTEGTSYVETWVGETVKINCATEDATLSYKLYKDGESAPAEYTAYAGEAIELSEEGHFVIDVLATKDGMKEATLNKDFHVLKNKANLAFSAERVAVYLENMTEFVSPTFTKTPGLDDITFTTTDAKVASYDEDNNVIVLGGKKGEATITASFAGNNKYEEASAAIILDVDVFAPSTASNDMTIVFVKDSNASYSDGKNAAATSDTAEAIAVLVSEGNEYIAKIETSTAYYGCDAGLRLGKSGTDGSATITLSNQCQITSIDVTGRGWRNEESTLTINGQSHSFTSSGNPTSENFTLTYSSTEPTNEIKLSAEKRVKIESLTIHTAKPAEDLKAPIPFIEEVMYTDPTHPENGMIIVFEAPENANVYVDFEKKETTTQNLAKEPKTGAGTLQASDANGVTRTFTLIEPTEGAHVYQTPSNEGTVHYIAYRAEDGKLSAPKVLGLGGIPTAVNGIAVEDNGEVIFFDMNGVRVDRPEKGIYIRVSNGKAEKILK